MPISASQRSHRLGAVVITALLLAACSGVPKPTEQLAVSKAAVAAASGERSSEFAPTEMDMAQTKLRAAERALAEGEYLEARRLAEQAEVDARLAERKSQAARAERSVAEVRESIRVLQQEIRP